MSLVGATGILAMHLTALLALTVATATTQQAKRLVLWLQLNPVTTS